MSEKWRVGISELKVAQSPVVLVSYGLGSCLGIAIYDPCSMLGGLAHTLLPEPRGTSQNERPAKFVRSAVAALVEELVERGADRSSLVAKVAGGANMFEALTLSCGEGVGARNIRAVRETLQQLSIPLAAEDVGGSYGRTVEFHPGSGELLIRSVRGGETPLTL